MCRIRLRAQTPRGLRSRPSRPLFKNAAQSARRMAVDSQSSRTKNRCCEPGKIRLLEIKAIRPRFIHKLDVALIDSSSIEASRQQNQVWVEGPGRKQYTVEIIKSQFINETPVTVPTEARNDPKKKSAYRSEGMSRWRTACRNALRPRGTDSFRPPTPELFVSAADSAACRPARLPPGGAERDSRPPELYLLAMAACCEDQQVSLSST